jgi:hypothetical protein
LELATPEQQQKLIQGVIKRVTPLSAKEIEIEFGIPVRGAVSSFDQLGGQYRRQQQAAVDSFILLKIKRRVA